MLESSTLPFSIGTYISIVTCMPQLYAKLRQYPVLLNKCGLCKNPTISVHLRFLTHDEHKDTVDLLETQHY